VWLDGRGHQRLSLGVMHRERSRAQRHREVDEGEGLDGRWQRGGGLHGRWRCSTWRHGRSPRMTATRWRSPRTTTTQHAEARSESTDDGGSVGASSRQNFGSVMAHGKKIFGVRVKGAARGNLNNTHNSDGPQMTSPACPSLLNSWLSSDVPDITSRCHSLSVAQQQWVADIIHLSLLCRR
jgi:hypothetical protein